MMGFARAQPIPRQPCLQTPINIFRILADGRLLLDEMMLRREVAHRVGGAGVAGEGESLAGAGGEMDLPARRAPPVRANAWQRQPPKSTSRRSQLRHGSGRKSMPRKALKAGFCSQISRNEWSFTDQNSRPGIDSAAWDGSPRPAGVTFSERRPQPPTQGLGKRA